MRYADDAPLIAENKENLPQLLDITEEESKRKGYGLKSKNTEAMVVNRNNECAQINSLVAKINSSSGINAYLGTLMLRDGHNNCEIASRTAQVENELSLTEIRTHKWIHLIYMRRRALVCFSEPILMYGC